jgi:hypothetical protein
MMNEDDRDFPVLTDVITAPVSSTDTVRSPAVDPYTVGQIEQTVAERLIGELSLQIPVLVEAALREYLPQAMGARLQAELLGVLTNALPIAAHAATKELSAQVAYELGGLLEQRLHDEVRRAVAEAMQHLSSPQS